MTKDSGLRIRVQRDLRDSFVEVCRAQDKPAAQVIREFMRSYVAQRDVENRSMANSEMRKRVRSKNNEL
jgi:Ribbon-helix-helix protein